MRKKLVWIFAVLIITAMVLGACAPKEPEVVPTEEVVAPTEEVVAPTEEPVLDLYADVVPATEITFWHQHSGDRETSLLEIVDEFNATNDYGITLTAEYAGGYGDIFTKMLPILNTADVPDIVVGYQNQIATYQLADSIWNMNEVIDSPTWGMPQADQDDFFPGFFYQDIFPSFNNMRLGFPPNRSMEVMYYNEDWLKELGYDAPPTTPEEFKEMACKAASTPFSGATAEGSMGYELSVDASRFASWTFAFGGDIFDYNNTQYSYDSDAAKEAMMIKEHDSQAQVHVFMMDMRAFSKGYEGYYRRAREQYGIEYIRCRISALREDPETGNLVVRYRRESSSGIEMLEETFDLVVLSVGMEISDSVKQLGRNLGIELDEYGFCHTAFFDPLQTTRPGIYAAGPFREPKDIPETVVDASGAAAQASEFLAASRFTLTRKAEFPPERDIRGEPPRIGVFVCHCGSNIGGYLDVPEVAEYALSLPGVVHAEDNLYTCSQDSIAHITEQVKELGLNRVVVASCTPITHAPLFQDSIRAAGLNPAMFEMANIRNQCSWVHSNDWEAATRKAKDLVRMAVARANTLEPVHTTSVPVERQALVVGGGAAGMTAALSLSQSGFEVHLVEKEPELGGNLRRVRYLLDGQDPRAFLDDTMRRVQAEPRIHLHLRSEVVKTSGFMGRFTSVLRTPQGEETIRHGVTILATGAQEYRGDEYGYGKHPRVLTGLEFESMLAHAEQPDTPLEGQARAAWEAVGGHLPSQVAMILCVGPAEKFCSRICCTTALKNALELKRQRPEARVFVLFKDIRTYGFKEHFYTEARRQGVIFLRYDDETPPVVDFPNGRLKLLTRDPQLGQDIALSPDLLVLSNPIVPSPDSRAVASTFKVPVDSDGFFLEAHVKLRPVDFSSEGLYMAGMAHYPKMLDETLVQARAAAARAARVLSQQALTAGGIVARVIAEKCVGCLTCVRVCPFDVPQVQPDYAGVGGIQGAAFIEPTICQGCGNCAAECPAKAIELIHYRDDQIMVKLDALLLGAKSLS